VHEKRYQVFISSTFQDLREERRAVQDVIISMGDFPVQMESFPAADEDQFEFIKSLIDKCDYYVLIIAGRYGTPAEDGISYTHKEFRYAVEKSVPVLVMLHGEPGKIPSDKLEETDAGRQSLKDFIKEAEHKRLRKTWTTFGDLKLAVREALDHAKATKPRVGWIRGDAVASIDTLEELNEVRKENEKFREALGNLTIEIALPHLPDPSDTIVLTLLAHETSRKYGEITRGSTCKVEGSWISFFPAFYSHFKFDTSDWGGDNYWHTQHDESCVAIGSAIVSELASFDSSDLFKLSRACLDRLLAYYAEAGLMTATNMADSPFTDAARKVARRHQIVAGKASFTIIEGSLDVYSSTQADTDDIPF